MMRFAYEARNDQGHLIGGVIAAPSMEEAGQKLSAGNFFVVKLGPADPMERAEWARKRTGSSLKARRSSVMWFINQLAIMVETGVVLSEALECLARQTRDKVMKQVLQGISDAVHEGRPLSDAMDEFPRTFPSTITAMIRASEASGTMPLILNRTAQYMLRDQQTMQRLRGALIYPAFLFFMCIGITIFLLTVILPRFEAVFVQKGAMLPAPTRVLMGLSGFVAGNALLLAAGIAALIIGTVLWLRTKHGHAMLDWFLLRVPVIGNILNKVYQARSLRAMGTLIETGVMLGEAIQLVRNVIPNVWYKKMWADAEDGVVHGQPISVPLANSPLMPETLVQMIDCGDRTGRLGMVCSKLAEFTETESEEAIKVGSQFIEPLMILLMGSIIGFVAIALLLPMFSAASVVSQ